MSPQQDPQASLLLAHVVSQIEHNVQFLASQGYISTQDASTILTRLPTAPCVDYTPTQGREREGPTSSLSSRFNKVIGGGTGTGGSRSVPPTPTPTMPQPQTHHEQDHEQEKEQQYRALWGYNQNNEDPNDLTFAPGDIITLIQETNADWWTGKAHGRTGLFPSTYVEKVPPITHAQTGKSYKPFGAAYHGMDAPPPQGQGTNSLGLAQQPEEEGKKDKFGGLKNTVRSLSYRVLWVLVLTTTTTSWHIRLWAVSALALVLQSEEVSSVLFSKVQFQISTLL